MITEPKTKVSFVSLGCFKNTVDTEVLGGMLRELNVDIVSPYEETDWIIINTCGFIQAAKEESIDEILEALEKKSRKEVKHVAVIGCLAQRYLSELQENFADADIVWGVNDMRELAEIISGKKNGGYRDSSLFLYDHRMPRITTTIPNTTFIKISEGCDMGCSFCAIPLIRGPFRSRHLDSVLREAEELRKKGFLELNLISQNSTHFGRDNKNNSALPELLKKLSVIGFPWIRVLYLMPEEVSDSIIEGFDCTGVLPYFDLPFQHVAAPVLKQMNRRGNSEEKLRLIEKIRSRYADAIIRSTFIVGFPGETEADFNEMCNFARESGIERIGVFGYSPEEQTRAFAYTPRIDPLLIDERREKLMDISDENLLRYNQKISGTLQEFLPMGPSPWKNGACLGRIASQAPEVDGLTEIDIQVPEDLHMMSVQITGHHENILQGEKI